MRWNFKMECLNILIAKMSLIVWLISELSEGLIEIYTSYSFSNSFVCLFVFCFWNKSDECFWKINLSSTSVYDNKMTSFVDLLTIALLSCPQWLDKTIHFCFACICSYRFTHFICYNWSKTVFKSTSMIRSSTLILYPCR